MQSASRYRLIAAIALTTIGFLVPSSTAHSRTASSDGRLFFLAAGGRVLSANADGSDLKVLITGRVGTPDGIVVDATDGYIYWTLMGRASADDGSIERMDLDGRNLRTIVRAGGTFTPKQLKLDALQDKLYWSDREGMRVMRSNLDGSKIETLVQTAEGDEARLDARNWCVGIALDVARGKVYWTQKGAGGVGSIRRAGIKIPKGETPDRRSDIEVLFDALPEPIDLDVDLYQRMIYWTDRGDPPRGNTVSRAPMDRPAGADPKTRQDQEILVRDLKEGIGIALDLRGRRMYFTDLGGNVYSAKLDGSDKRTLITGQGALTGIAYVREDRQLPQP